MSGRTAAGLMAIAALVHACAAPTAGSHGGDMDKSLNGHEVLRIEEPLIAPWLDGVGVAREGVFADVDPAYHHHRICGRETCNGSTSALFSVEIDTTAHELDALLTGQASAGEERGLRQPMPVSLRTYPLHDGRFRHHALLLTASASASYFDLFLRSTGAYTIRLVAVESAALSRVVAEEVTLSVAGPDVQYDSDVAPMFDGEGSTQWELEYNSDVRSDIASVSVGFSERLVLFVQMAVEMDTAEARIVRLNGKGSRTIRPGSEDLIESTETRIYRWSCGVPRSELSFEFGPERNTVAILDADADIRELSIYSATDEQLREWEAIDLRGPDDGW